MKRSLQLFMATILAISVMPLSFVMAMEDSPTDQPTTNNSNTDQSGENETESEPVVEEDTAKPDFETRMKERMQKRKEAMKAKLTLAQQNRIKTRCKTTQGTIKSISTKAKEVQTTRDEIYEKVITRLTKFSEALKKKGANTTELDKEITELKAKVAAFKTDMASLRQAGSDIANMDCATDPTGFKASLDALRAARETVVNDSKEIKTYIEDTIKPTLQTTRKTVKDEKTGETN